MNVIKTNIQNLAMLSAVITFASCESSKKVEIKEDGTEVIEVRKPEQDTVNKVAKPEAESRSVSGKVTKVNFGKDGYTAIVSTASGENYAVTISHSNLTDHTQYKEFKVGEELKATGDFWKNAEAENQITARKID
ncbi:hypothetical protein [Flavobacterium sp.]|uniref:hypothetical protein n=1 Tax=Flavobacterium sp. TaxID=239 RepID=UPI00120107E7|nr:hypothetical protein [Flavobacterium sp.]RZJ70478.1 MAG: hypothetical protein EOO49_13540 [Flavobacterium sp.]